MRYLLLIYNNEATVAEFATQAGATAIGTAHGAIVDELSASGELIELKELDQADARVVRVRRGARLVTDGPFHRDEGVRGRVLPGRCRRRSTGCRHRRTAGRGPHLPDRGAAHRDVTPLDVKPDSVDLRGFSGTPRPPRARTAVTSPPSEATCCTRELETWACAGSGSMKMVSTPARSRFTIAIGVSYATSICDRMPFTSTLAPTSVQ